MKNPALLLSVVGNIGAQPSAFHRLNLHISAVGGYRHRPVEIGPEDIGADRTKALQ